MTWPELVNPETGHRVPFNVLTRAQLQIYISTPRGWMPGAHGPGASQEVRVLIAKKMLEGMT